MKSGETEPDPHNDGDDFEALHDEVERLPRKYREAVVLCAFEGMTLEAAAGQLGCPIGTLGVRLMRAKERLKKRLTLRGVSEPAGLVVGNAGKSASPALPSEMVASIVNAVMQRETGGIVSVAAANLTTDVLRNMFVNKLATTVAGIAVTLTAVVSVGGLALPSGIVHGKQSPGRKPTQVTVIWIGLKVVTKYGAPVATDSNVAQFRDSRRIFTVKEFDGEQVKLVSSEGTGWIETNKIVRFDRAIDFYTSELRNAPENAAAYFERGVIWLLLEKKGETIADFTEAIRLDPKNALAYHWRGRAFHEKKEFVKAIADFTETIRLNPSGAAAFLDRGRAWDDTGEFDKAVNDFTESIRLDPKSAVGFHNRGHARTCKGDHDNAIADFTEAIRLDPADAYAYVGAQPPTARGHSPAGRNGTATT